MYDFLKKRARALSFALSGMKLGFLREGHLRLHLIALILVITPGFYYHISTDEWLFIFGYAGLVISMELINTAIEKICDLVDPKENPQIKYIKDLGAAGVLIAALTALVVACIIFKKYILHV